VTTRRAAVYFVATRHAEYAAPAYFPEGSVVLDPWGYIPDQAGVNVIRIGRQPTPATISILCPTRGRPDQFARMVDSALDLAARPEAVEVVAYFDNDDPAGYQAGRYRAVRGPRILLSEAWNECRGAAAGPIYMHAGDDLIFRTRGWDGLVRDAFGVVEIGADRGEGSTGVLWAFCRQRGIPFYSVDFDPAVAKQAHDRSGAHVWVMRGEDFLVNAFPRDQRIRFAYLDNFDWIPRLQGAEDLDFVREQIDRYAALDVAMTNEACQLAHISRKPSSSTRSAALVARSLR
jgi:hypothetical protein